MVQKIYTHAHTSFLKSQGSAQHYGCFEVHVLPIKCSASGVRWLLTPPLPLSMVSHLGLVKFHMPTCRRDALWHGRVGGKCNKRNVRARVPSLCFKFKLQTPLAYVLHQRTLDADKFHPLPSVSHTAKGSLLTSCMSLHVPLTQLDHLVL